MSEEKGTFWSASKYRAYRIGLMLLVLLLLTEVGVRIYFARDDVTERNPGNTAAALPYLFEQIEKWEGRKVVVLGSSVAQGYGNCLPGRHFPALLEKKLRQKYNMKDVRVFNLSSAGSRWGDHLAKLVESERHRPDLFIASVHMKIFSVHASLLKPFSHEEAIYYLRNEPETFQAYRKQFSIDDARYRQIWLDFQARKVSALYRHCGLISYFLTGNYRRPAFSAADFVKAELGWMDAVMVEAHRTTQRERNEDYLWKVIPDHVVQLNYSQCEAFDFSDENVNWKTFVEFSRYAQQHDINVLFYLSPINRSFVEQKKFFDWEERVPFYKQRALNVCSRYGHRLLDAIEKVDYRYFSDLDHLNMNGHEQLANYMLPHVARQLRRR